MHACVFQNEEEKEREGENNGNKSLKVTVVKQHATQRTLIIHVCTAFA